MQVIIRRKRDSDIQYEESELTVFICTACKKFGLEIKREWSLFIDLTREEYTITHE